MKKKKILLNILILNWLIYLYQAVICNIDNSHYLITLLGGNIAYFLFIDYLINKKNFERFIIKDKKLFVNNLLLYPKTLLILMFTQITKSLNGILIITTMILLVIYMVFFDEYYNDILIYEEYGDEQKND